MAIYKAVKKDLGTGSITGESQQSYVVPYYVFTDNNASPHDIYEQARSANGIVIYDVNNNPTKNKLPVYGDVDSTTCVSNINIERASENNLIAVPQYGLNVNDGRKSSWTCWNYVVTFSANDTTTISTGDAPWNKDEAISCSFSPKTYERYDNKTLVPNYKEKGESTVVPNYPIYEEKYQNLQNTVGDDLYRSRTVYNYLLNFSYAVKRFDAEWLPLYMNTMNLKDCVVCGIPIKKYHACINELRVEQAEWNGITYYNVNVEIEIQYQQRITYDEYVSSGHRACMIEGSTASINSYLRQRGLTKEKAGFVYKYTTSGTVKKYPVPIEELSDIRQRDKIPNNRWFIKKKNLGYFEEAVKVSENTETVPVTRKIYVVNGTVGQSETITISYINPSTYSSVSGSTATVSGSTVAWEETLYYLSVSSDNSYIYSTQSQGTSQTDTANIRVITFKGSGTNTTYYLTKDVIKHTITKTAADPLQGQYASIQNPIALNKYGGIYLAEGETSTIDNASEPSKIDMYDPMLGKVQDYQHVARDWKALAFPKKGMFWSVTDDNNFMMNKVSKYFN